MLALAELGCRTFIEVGPHPVLLPIAQACLGAKARSAAWTATLNRQKSDANSIAEMLAALYRAGHDVNWAAVHADARGGEFRCRLILSSESATGSMTTRSIPHKAEMLPNDPIRWWARA